MQKRKPQNRTKDGRLPLFVRIPPELMRSIDAAAILQRRDRTSYVLELLRQHVPVGNYA